tara:strand:+ start:2916 stop:3344 length:429 start_codon:yes stop_codon:yes gene_type:complete
MLKTRQVYIISSPLTDKVYIGSTSKPLEKRLSLHKSNVETTSRYLISLGEVKISPLCIIKNCSKKDIEIKEKDYIFLMRDIILNIRDTKDSKNKGYIRPYILNGKKTQQQNQKHTCLICNTQYTQAHKARHERTKKHLKSLT